MAIKNKMNWVLSVTFSLCFCVQSFGQITITEANIPVIGDVYTEAHDTTQLNLIDEGPAGPNQSWYFQSTMSMDFEDSTLFLPVSASDYGNEFTEADYLMIPRSSPKVFAIVDSTQISLIGWEWRTKPTDGREPYYHYDRPYKILSLPASYTTSSLDTTAYNFSVDRNDTLQTTPVLIILDSLKTTNRTIINDTIDAWGTITTPDSTYNTIRQKTVSTMYDTTFMLTNFGWSVYDKSLTVETTYKWWTDQLRAPVAEIIYEDTVMVQASYLKTTITGLPKADFTYAAASLNVDFTDGSYNNPTSWSWDFGDGNTSISQSPSHPYSIAGTYEVCLTITNSKGNDTYCDSVSVNITSPISAFTYNVDTFDVQFTDACLFFPDTWSWDFGDGNTSTLQSPGNTYSAAGTYQVCLICANSAGSDTSCQSININCSFDLVIDKFDETPVTNCDTSTADGYISLTISGGTSPYTYLWSNGATTQAISNVSNKTYVLTATDANGCIGITSHTMSCDPVWPGDVNDNGSANHYDLLGIGLNFKSTGPARNAPWDTTDWGLKLAAEWSTTQKNGINSKHADCNGDGMIDSDDVLAIVRNFGETHSKSSSFTRRPSNPDLYFEIDDSDIAPGSTVEVSIMAGRDTNTVAIYGIGFEVKVDVNLIEPGTMEMIWDSSWMGTLNSTLIVFDTIQQSSGDIFAACVRTTLSDTSSFGEIARLKFKIKADTTIPANSGFNIQLTSDEGGVVASGDTVNFNNSQDTVVVNPTSISSEFRIQNSELKVFPNPASDNFTIYFKGNQKILKYEIYNLIGELITYKEVKRKESVKIHTDNYQNGIYFIRVYSGKNSYYKKIILN